MKYIFSFILLLAGVAAASAVTNWFSIFYKGDGIQKIKALKTTDIDSVFFTSDPSVDPAAITTLNMQSSDGEGIFSVPLDSVISAGIRSNIPTIYITTDPYVDEVPDKENYLTAKFAYIPYDGATDTLETTVSIRGRGNSSWTFPQKSYRLKFDKKQSIAGLEKAKSYVLITNYIDNTLLKNAVGYKIAELLELPYTNTAVPVDVVFNGKPRGNYVLTHKVGINAGSADFDETQGILWEIDTNYDEDYRFRSSRYYLPCMVKDPDFRELAETDAILVRALWAYWKADLDLAIAKVYDGQWSQVFDARQLAKYLVVNDVVANFELNHPKSMFLYKPWAGDKYYFGPVWDFDWAFAYAGNVDVNTRLIRQIATVYETDSYEFFAKIFSSDEFMSLFKEEFDNFCDNHLQTLMDFIDDYAEKVRISAYQNYEIWPEEHFYSDEADIINTAHFQENVDNLKAFILERIEKMKADPRFLLY